MSKHVIETVTFRLRDGISRADFAAAAAATTAWVSAQPGFVARHLSCAEDGTWTEHIRWQDMASASAAAAGIGTSADTAAFLSAIDGPSARVSHSELEIALP